MHALVLKPSARAAGSKDPVTARVVVTRIARAGAAEHGIVRDGYQYELFATTLSAEAWPCEDVVALYCARASIESRFAQEDREFDLSRDVTACWRATPPTASTGGTRGPTADLRGQTPTEWNCDPSRV